MKNGILLVGGGGHCSSVLDSILTLNVYDHIGIIDSNLKVGTQIMGIPVLGCDEDLRALFYKGYKNAFITIGSIGDPTRRLSVYQLLCDIGFNIPYIVDVTAIVSKFSSIESGVFVGKRAIINAGTSIQKCAIINSASVIEHDCIIGPFAHIAPGAVLGGCVKIGDKTHIGMNTSVKQGLVIGCDSIIGMGSVVLKNIDNSTVAYGNPCKEVNNNERLYNR